MKINKFVVDGAPDVGAIFADGRIWPKIMSVPMMIEAGRLFNSPLYQADAPTNDNMIVTGTPAAPKIFQYVVPADKVLIMAELNMIIVDSGVTPERFGSIPALANGVLWRIVDGLDQPVYNFHGGLTPGIKANYEFYLVSGSQIQIQAGDDTVTVNWKAAAMGVNMILRPGYKIQFVIRDNLTAMKVFKAAIFGCLISPEFRPDE